jgi:F-box domain
MNKLYLDLLHEIFSYLTPKEQARISRTCKNFQYIYKYRGDDSIDPNKHGFYEPLGGLRVGIYEIKEVKKIVKDKSVEIFSIFRDGEMKNVKIIKKKRVETYVTFKNGDKREILRDREGNPFCNGDILLGLGFLYRYELGKLDKLFKKFCKYCQKFEYCIENFKTVDCKVCTKKYESCSGCDICESCFKIKYPNFDAKFKKLEIVFGG